ncbi:hypothetical protein ABZ383_27485 [Streptomyces sp. NPDC005900]|uniref:hypothetical protein n=1 Tax=Streptomyces sp. NPDC005900 TaxID=3154569 RepID=UPI0034039EC4
MTDQPAGAGLRDRIRRAICEASGFAWDDDGLEPDECGEHADAVLAVLPAPADRAVVLREAAAVARDEAAHLHDDMGQKAAAGARLVADRLSRMAEEAQQGDTAGERR